MAIISEYDEEEPPETAEAFSSSSSSKTKESEKESSGDAENKGGRRVPNKGNGLDLERYSWGQTLEEVTVDLPVPNGTKSRFVVCEIKKNHLKVGLKGQPPVIDGELYRMVKSDECFWSIEDQSTLSILLTKAGQMEWWQWLVKGGPEIDTQKVKDVFDQRQKSMGLPTSDEMQRPEALKKFMAERLDMEFSRPKMYRGHENDVQSSDFVSDRTIE